MINKIFFLKVDLDKNIKIYIVYITCWLAILIYPNKKVCIKLLLAYKTFIKNLFKYFDYDDIFSTNFAIVLLKYTDINNHVIKLKEGKQLFYKSIYSFRSKKLEILKI